MTPVSDVTGAKLNITREEAQSRAALLTVSNYEVDLDLTGDAATFVSRTTVQFTATGSDKQLALGTWIDFVAAELSGLNFNGHQLDPKLVFNGTRIHLQNLHLENTLVVEGRGAYSSTGEGMHRFIDPVDGETYLYTQFEVPDSRRVFAVFEQPDLKAEFQFTLTTPDHWRVISNSPTPEPLPASSGAATWVFDPTPRLPSYVTALIAGPYKGLESSLTSADDRKVPLGIYTRASLVEHLDAENIAAVTRAGFAFFEKTFGLPYPFRKYDQIFVPDFNAGAMENAGAVTILESYVFRSAVPQAMRHARAITILHELAHMWFGDLVTMRWWNDLWLNESFAEFTSTLAAAEGTSDFRDSWVAFAAVQKSWAYRQDQLSSTHPIIAEINDLEDVAVNFDGITYAKGASVLRQLVAWVGQENFFSGVRSYIEEFTWANTELSDLMRHLQCASGRDLEAWTRQWLQSSGVNTVATELNTDDDGLITSLRIRQIRDESDQILRPHRVQVGIYDSDSAGQLVRTDVTELDVDGELTEVTEFINRPRGVLILPNDGDLAYCKIRLDEVSTSNARDRLSDVQDPLARALLWTSLWESVRDGVTGASEFIELFARHAHVERNSSVLRTLLRHVELAMSLYVHPDKSDSVQSRLAGALHRLLESAEPGSDPQLQFLKAFFRQASGDQLSFLQQLESGTAQIKGRQIDTDLHWELLTALASHGVSGIEDQIAAAAHTDATANGQLAEIEALAARPSATVKADVWNRIMVDPSYTNSEQRRAIAGFKRAQNKDLLADYAPQFFDHIPAVWSGASKELALTVAVHLFPTYAVHQQTLNHAERTIDSVDTEHPALSRMLKEGRDELHRALKARQADAYAPALPLFQ